MLEAAPRRTTVWHRRREASRRCSALLWRVDQSQQARHGARARQARMLRHLPKDRQRSGTHAHLPRESRLCVARRSWHIIPRSCAKGDRPPTGVVPSYSAWIDNNERGTARARAASSRASSPPKRPAAQWRARACHAKADFALEAASGTSHHSLTSKERGLPPVQCHSMVRGPITTSVARRARAVRSRASSPPKRQAAQWRAPRVPCKSRLCVGGRSFIAPRSGTARARGKRACSVASQETGSAVALACAGHAKAG